MTRYLKQRPRSADSPWSQATNRYGIHMKTFQKKLLTELVDEYVKKHWEDIYFLKLLNELSVYGVKNTDRVMSFGMALIHDMDENKRIYDKSEESDNAKMEGLPEFTRNESGGLITMKPENDYLFENPKRNVTFDYNLDNDTE